MARGTLSSSHVDAFFARYPTFDYDDTQPIVDEFERMGRHFRWNSKTRRSRRRLLQDALAMQFSAYYGTDVDDINAWKAMCVVLGFKEIPEDLKSCRAVVKSAHANIYDYVEAKRLGVKVGRFRSVKALAEYSYKNNKIFPLNLAKAGGVLRYLLRTLSTSASGLGH